MKAGRGEQAKTRVLDAARELLLTEGVSAYSVEAVAREAGAARTTVYRHWPQPHALLVECLASMVPEFHEPDTGALESDLRELFAVLLAAFEDEGLRQLFLEIISASVRDPAIDEIRRRIIEHERQPVRKVIEQAIARGEIASDIDIDIAFHMIEGPLVSRRLLQNEPIDDAVLDRLIARIVAALTCPAP